ncbi:MAG: hypothetical protein ACK4VO_13575 [Pseudobdellovibrio sp.]
MKIFFLILATSLNLFAYVGVDSLIGRWSYVGFHYQGNYFQKPNPDLHVTFEFEQNNKVKLSWVRDDDGSHCTRIADYSIIDSVIHQTVVWVDPENSFGCSSDPDMVLGKTSKTTYSVSENVLNLYLSLNGEELVYVLNRL